MIIKKFKNHKIKLTIEKAYDITPEGDIDENVYHNDMSMSDLCINQINGYQYIVDFNTSTVYDLGSYLMQNPLKWLLEKLKEENTMYLYPCSRKESKSLLEDLENGY